MLEPAMRAHRVDAQRGDANVPRPRSPRITDVLAGLAGIACALSTGTGCSALSDRHPHGFIHRAAQASPVVRHSFELRAHDNVVFETRNLRHGIRPILHLWDESAQIEVARGEGGWLRASATLAFRNPYNAPRRYILVVHAAESASSGRVDVLRDGRIVLGHVEVAGTILKVPGGRGFTYRAASEPGGARSPWLYGLDEEGALVAIGAPDGDLGMPSIATPARIARVVVAAGDGSAARGTLSLFANDPQDHDGDGLGRSLERALGTCDGPEEPGCAASALTAYYRQVEHTTRDTDRDGIDDAAELFGVRESRRLDLPRYGADPRHKDVFIEVDFEEKLEGPLLSEQDIIATEELFSRGQARDLQNPDARPGVHLHLDVGASPKDQGLAGLYGDWGGSDAVAAGAYVAARGAHMAPARRGFFRYALAASGGTGQTRGDAFTFNAHQHRARFFAHELGHTLGLAHHGDRSFGVANCKPNYQSIMNYAYQNDERVGFSPRASPLLNPVRVLEAGGLKGLGAGQLTEAPYELQVVGRGVDWNRDGMIEDKPVRAGLTWATYKSCGAAEPGRQSLWQGAARSATPALIRTGQRLHVLWVDATGAVLSRDGLVSGPDDRGSCPLGDGADSACMNFSPPQVVVGARDTRHLAVAPLDEQHFVLVSTHSDGQLRVQTLLADDTAARRDASPYVEIPLARSEQAPAVAWMRVDASMFGIDRVLSVFWRAASDGTLMQALATRPEGPWLLKPVRDDQHRMIYVGVAPSIANLGTGELCGVFPDAESFIRFYCYLPERDLWTDLTAQAFYAGLGPATLGQVGMAYHRYRYADGNPVDGEHARGAVYLSFTELNSHIEPDNPKFYISQWLGTQRSAREAISFEWRGAVTDQWTNLAPHTGVALYEDERLSALKAAMATQSVKGGDTKIQFLPLADGASDAPLGSGNDFQVMARGICRGIRSEAWCGDRSTATY